MSAVRVLRPDWAAPPGVRSVVTLRCENEIETPGLARDALSLPSEPAWLEQVHGTGVANLDVSSEARPKADASVTHQGGRICAVRVADCLPVLFADQDGTAVGAAHAGWRGLAAGVLEATVAAMGSYPSHLSAWLGPAIGPDHFEVGDDVREAFLAQGAAAQAAFTSNARGRWQCDLYQLARQRLEAIGVATISGGGACTYCDPGQFYSYRREGRTGRMAALIWLA